MTDSDVWRLEERLWLEGPAAYEELLHPQCVMTFPGVGIMSAEAIMQSVKDAPRWSRVELGLRKLGRGGADVAVIAYQAEGHRDGAAPYRAFCTSTCEAGRWQIIQHQQTPVM